MMVSLKNALEALDHLASSGIPNPKEALAKRRASGKQLGRPQGTRAKRYKLDEKFAEIMR